MTTEGLFFLQGSTNSAARGEEAEASERSQPATSADGACTENSMQPWDKAEAWAYEATRKYGGLANLSSAHPQVRLQRKPSPGLVPWQSASVRG